MNEEGLIDVPEEQTSAGMPVAIVSKPIPSEIKPQITAAQAKIEAVAELTHSAYQKAATLKLTAEETALLQEDFPDEAFKPGAAGKENLIYIEHAFLRERFIKVFGMGGWALVPRNRWAEPFRTQKGTEGSRVYVEAMLVVRGCFVAEAVGEMEYYMSNAAQNYGDAVEGAKTAAFRRCAKEFGVGLQAWKKDWCQGWWDRKMAPNKRVIQKPTTGTMQPVKIEPNSRPVTGSPKPDMKMATAFTRKWMIEQLNMNDPGISKLAIDYFFKIGQLLSTESIEDLPLQYVPITRKELDAMASCLANFEDGGEAVRAFEPHQEPNVPRGTSKDDGSVDYAPEDEAWREFPMPWGKQAGVLLGKLEKNYLFGLWANYTVETEYKGKPKNPETISKDQEFRAMLDLAGSHYGFKKRD